MHAAGWVHGDVHTANVRIGEGLESWTARLVDFGAARALTADGAKDDVINVARIVVENLSGKLYHDASALSAASQHIAMAAGRRVLLSDVLRRAMAGEYRDVDALDAALAHFDKIAP
jgi:hypothetical protein